MHATCLYKCRSQQVPSDCFQTHINHKNYFKVYFIEQNNNNQTLCETDYIIITNNNNIIMG